MVTTSICISLTKHDFLVTNLPQEFLRNLDPFRGRSPDELLTDLYNQSLEIEPKGLTPKQCSRITTHNLALLPPKMVRVGILDWLELYQVAR